MFLSCWPAYLGVMQQNAFHLWRCNVDVRGAGSVIAILGKNSQFHNRNWQWPKSVNCNCDPWNLKQSLFNLLSSRRLLNFISDLVYNVGVQSPMPREERRSSLFMGMGNAVTSCGSNLMIISILSPGRKPIACHGRQLTLQQQTTL